ncbi:ADP-ribosylation_factor 1 [Hexamita inflata]|uniref:ADP-ribosylation factor 1 n=1 Tax=Hexamita inflata TaxID=28002 RepID=A0AA86NW00_9EUKA|nr:ADP-ribosylation factor 1 [Hexamita inflata]
MKNIINLISGKPQEIRAVMLGLDNSGKTKILQQWKQSEVVQTNPTIGFNFETIQTQRQNVSIWDVGGEIKQRNLWSYHTVGTNILIFVIDSTERDYNRVQQTKAELLQLLQSEALNKKPFLILFNKSDLPNSMSKEEILEEYQISLGMNSQIMQKKHKVNVIKYSAMNYQNIEQVFDWIRSVSKFQPQYMQ